MAGGLRTEGDWKAGRGRMASGLSEKRRATRGSRRVAGLVVLLVATASLACSSLPPVRAIRAARYYAAGTRALERGDDTVAIQELERAAALMPNASEIHNHLGLAYWSDGRERAAERELERALELDCDNDAARANLARLRVFRAAGDAEKRSASNGG
jgi:Tfp pilus assembly protein PilF